MMTLLGIITIVFFIMFCFFLLRTWNVDNFRRFARNGNSCTFYIGESRWMGEIKEFSNGIARIRYFIGNEEKETELPISELYP